MTMKALRFFEMSCIIQQLTQRNILEELNLQQCHCGNIQLSKSLKSVDVMVKQVLIPCLLLAQDRL
jgi:hypothetical protein